MACTFISTTILYELDRARWAVEEKLLVRLQPNALNKTVLVTSDVVAHSTRVLATSYPHLLSMYSHYFGVALHANANLELVHKSNVIR